MAADTILVKSGLDADRVALWERDKRHPDGEVKVAGDTAVEVGMTETVGRHLREGRLVRVRKIAATTVSVGPKLTDIDGVGPTTANRLREAGIGSVAELAEVALSLEVEGASREQLRDWREQARALIR